MIDVGRGGSVEVLVGLGRVVDLAVVVGFGSEVLPVTDFVPVWMFVFDGLEPPFDPAVGLGCSVPGTDMSQMPFVLDPAGESSGFETRPVIGHDLELGDLACLGVGEVFNPGHTQNCFDLGQRYLEELDGLSGCFGHGDSAGQAVTGPVVDHTAQVPHPSTVGLEFAEGQRQPCGCLPEPVLLCRWGDERLGAITGHVTNLARVVGR